MNFLLKFSTVFLFGPPFVWWNFASVLTECQIKPATKNSQTDNFGFLMLKEQRKQHRTKKKERRSRGICHYLNFFACLFAVVSKFIKNFCQTQNGKVFLLPFLLIKKLINTRCYFTVGIRIEICHYRCWMANKLLEG